MTQPDGEAIAAELGQAIADTFNQHEHGFVLKWLALVETSNPDGRRGLWTMTSDDVTAWDTVGMLQHALHLEQAQAINPAPDDD